MYTYMEPTDTYDQILLRGTIRKGSWAREEDDLLRKCIEKYGEGKWNQIPARAGLNRCRKSCRLRWLNYLQPNINHGEFAMDEVDLIIRMHKLLGNKWSIIAGRLPGRTANGIKNYWNTHLKQSKQRPESNVMMKQPKQLLESNVTHLKQSKQHRPESNVTMNINKVDDKQIIRNDHQNEVHVIAWSQPQKNSENSKGLRRKSILMHRSTDIEQPASPKMVTKSTDHSHEPLPELLTDDALTSWWKENIDAFIDHDDHRMEKREGVVLLADKAINSGCCCRCRCNKSTTTDDQWTKSQQDLCVDDYLLNELQNIPC